MSVRRVVRPPPAEPVAHRGTFRTGGGTAAFASGMSVIVRVARRTAPEVEQKVAICLSTV